MAHRHATETPFYRGSSKHKNRPANEQKGTLCPEWTHQTAEGGLGADVHAHNWGATRAANLFKAAVVDQSTGRHYATAEGIAFEAKPSADGSWHGYRFDKRDIHWAMKTDTR